MWKERLHLAGHSLSKIFHVFECWFGHYFSTVECITHDDFSSSPSWAPTPTSARWCVGRILFLTHIWRRTFIIWFAYSTFGMATVRSWTPISCKHNNANRNKTILDRGPLGERLLWRRLVDPCLDEWARAARACMCGHGHAGETIYFNKFNVNINAHKSHILLFRQTKENIKS